MNKDVEARTLQRLEESGGGGDLGRQRRRPGDTSQRDVDVKGEALGGTGPACTTFFCHFFQISHCGAWSWAF